MSSLKDLRRDGLKELRENGLKGLKVRDLKDLILKPADSRTVEISDTELEDLTKKREEVKGKIRKLDKEKKEIEIRIALFREARKEKDGEISELPWREEIFPPLSRNTRVERPELLEVKNDFFHGENTEFSESKVNGVEREVKRTDKKSEDETAEGKISKAIRPGTDQPIMINGVQEADLESGIGKTDVDKAFPEKEEKIKILYPFSAEKLNEKKNYIRGFSESSIEKDKTEIKNSMFGLLKDNLIEEMPNNDDLNPEKEQSFIRYLEESETEELINDLKDIRSILTRTEHAG